MNVVILSVVRALAGGGEASISASGVHGEVIGRTGGVLLTLLICWTGFASVFALLLAYSRIPYVAPRDGFFFSAFARLHPR